MTSVPDVVPSLRGNQTVAGERYASSVLRSAWITRAFLLAKAKAKARAARL